MNTPLMERPFPDVEDVLMDLLDPRITATVVATGAELAPPMLQVERVGGGDDGITDRARVRIGAIGKTRPETWALARQVHVFLTQQVVGRIEIRGPLTAAEWPQGVQLDRVVSTGPRQTPERGRDARFVDALYDIDVRRPWW